MEEISSILQQVKEIAIMLLALVQSVLDASLGWLL